MKKKKGFFRRTGEFLTGKGFYIVLLLCAALIGVTAWVYTAMGRGQEEPVGTGGTQVAAGSGSSAEDLPDVQDAAQTQAPVGGHTELSGSEPASADVGTPPEAQTSIPSEEQRSEPTVHDIEFTWPLDGAIETTHAMNSLIYDKTMCDWRTHDGLDMACRQGTMVMAVADGTVEKVYDDYMLGTTVVIDHGAGVKTSYSNLEAVPTVSEGDWVWAGYVIGTVGDTAQGESGMVSHLHVAMTIQGQSVDPEDYFPE